jgi:hypothetical protein
MRHRLVVVLRVLAGVTKPVEERRRLIRDPHDLVGCLTIPLTTASIADMFFTDSRHWQHTGTHANLRHGGASGEAGTVVKYSTWNKVVTPKMATSAAVWEGAWLPGAGRLNHGAR